MPAKKKGGSTGGRKMMVGAGFLSNIIKKVVKPVASLARKTGLASTLAAATGNPILATGLKATGFGRKKKGGSSMGGSAGGRRKRRM